MSLSEGVETERCEDCGSENIATTIGLDATHDERGHSWWIGGFKCNVCGYRFDGQLDEGFDEDYFFAGLFDFEYCDECGGDVQDHVVGPDPLGKPHAWCKPCPMHKGVWGESPICGVCMDDEGDVRPRWRARELGFITESGDLPT